MRPRVKPAQALPPIWPYVGCDGCVGAGAAGLFVALVSTGFGLPVSEDVLLVSLGSRLGAMRPATRAAHCVAAVKPREAPYFPATHGSQSAWLATPVDAL